MTSFFFAVCLNGVVIKLENEVQKRHGSKAGEYEKASNVNGKPSYKKDNHAIWYNGKNAWMIGSIENLGTSIGSIYANNNFGGLTDEENEWKYQFNGWKIAGTNDVIAECSGNSQLLPNFFYFVNR